MFLDLTNYEPGGPFPGVTQTIATTVASNYLLWFTWEAIPIYGAALFPYWLRQAAPHRPAPK